ncbi:unnamed protein product [Paramecium sonneborni]|uniref:Uncharacterized protein n=1 Tax=Paramecium sonneborni TaxID=65129 RepID=A0A8S1KAU0_9CILI|nr:unnamed protein product [Paramecium sonneborni]
MSKTDAKNLKEEIQKLYDPLLFYQHGDNPAYKRYIEIMQENAQEGKQIDPRTYFVNKLQRIHVSRNIQDFVERDLKCFNFVRIFPVWICTTGFFLQAALTQRQMFLPIGQRGITSIRQTSFFYNFGYVGLAGYGLYLLGASYLWWQVTKMTAVKFYKHCLLGERQWSYERERQNNTYGNYYFKDVPLSCEENFPDLARGEIAKKQRPKPEW